MPIPNPAVIPRRRGQPGEGISNGVAPSNIIFTGIIVALATFAIATTSWARRWSWSGAALESALLIYGDISGSRILPHVPLWSILATLNLIYAVCSTSWLLHALFVAISCPLVLGTSLIQSSIVANLARSRLRAALKQIHFTRDKIALFNLPALEIDTDVDGLMVVRGVTISLSNLTIVAHGIELGLKLTDDIELSMYADQVKISLFRLIEVGDVFGNIKGLGAQEMTFADLDEHNDPGDDDETIFIGDTPLLRAATSGSEGFKDRPKLRKSMTGGASDMKDSSFQSGVDSITTLSPDDEEAEKQYMHILNDITTGSPVYQSRLQVRQRSRDDQTLATDDEKDMRAAICAELHAAPSISHPPSRSIRVTTLQRMSNPKVRRFLHRLPLLYRLLLGPLSYFHPIRVNSVSVSGSGKWLTALLQDKIFKHHADSSGELRRLTRRVSAWLAGAHFCLQLDDIDALGQVPLSTDFDIVTYLNFADVMAYRTTLDPAVSGEAEAAGATAQTPLSSPHKSHHKRQPEKLPPIAQVVRLGGADATFTIPSFLLPHHEHILPPRPTHRDETQVSEEIRNADGKPKTVLAEKTLERLQKDEANITVSVHASLPACFDQSLLNFIAALVKATKIIEMERTADEMVDAEDRDPDVGLSRTNTEASMDDTASIASITSTSTDADSTGHTSSKLRGLTKQLRANLHASGNMTKEAIRDFAKDVQTSTRDNIKKAVVGSVVNDRWIAKMVGKVAAKLETAQGNLGYAGAVPVGLGFYRNKFGDAHLSKILP